MAEIGGRNAPEQGDKIFRCTAWAVRKLNKNHPISGVIFWRDDRWNVKGEEERKYEWAFSGRAIGQQQLERCSATRILGGFLASDISSKRLILTLGLEKNAFVKNISALVLPRHKGLFLSHTIFFSEITIKDSWSIFPLDLTTPTWRPRKKTLQIVRQFWCLACDTRALEIRCVRNVFFFFFFFLIVHRDTYSSTLAFEGSNFLHTFQQWQQGM